MGLPDSTEGTTAQERLVHVSGMLVKRTDQVLTLAEKCERLERELAEARDLLRPAYDEDCGLSVWSDTPLGQKVRAASEPPDCKCGHDNGWHSYAWDDAPEDGPACDFVDCVCGIYEPAEGGEVHQ